MRRPVPPNDEVVRQLHKLQTDPEMERIMSAEDLFEIEQQRIHEDLTQALFESEMLREESDRRREESDRQREEEQRLREEAEQEINRLRKLLEEATGAAE
jgi:preprotein translocase subunit SecA